MISRACGNPVYPIQTLIFLDDKVSVNDRQNQAYKDKLRPCDLIAECLPFHQWQESMVQA